MLINKNVTDESNAIAIYANPNVRSITVPNGVKTLAPYLFQGNKTIEEIDLNGAKYIGESAFAYSNLSSIHNAGNVVDAGIDGFINTPWLKNQTGDTVKLGQVLLYYKGNSAQVLENQFGDVVRIGEYAFMSDSLTTVVLPASVETIGQNAFTKCGNLQWILFNSTNAPILNGECFKPNVQLYVKQTALNAYRENIFYKELPNALSSKSVHVNFYNTDGQYLGSSTEAYYSSFDQTLVPPSVEGHEFTYWADENGIPAFTYDIFTYYNDVKLYANYKPDEYSITFESDLGSEKKFFQYGDTVSVLTPVKRGYTFLGWYDSKTAGTLIIDTKGACVWQKMSSVKSLYARFSANVYSITYSTSKGAFKGAKPLNFTVEKPITQSEIPEIVEFGHVFNGWRVNGKAFTTTYGIFNNITLTANWLGTNMNVYSSTNTTINNEYTVVNMINAPQSVTHKFYIGFNVKFVTFMGSASNTYTDMQIIVNDRSAPLVMGFSNMNFQPAKSVTGTGSSAINASNGSMLYVSYKGTNKIVGGNGSDGTNGYAEATHIDGYKGGYAINTHSVTLMAFDGGSKIDLYGGNGGKGGNGFAGAKGKDGKNAPSGSIFKPVKGDNGAAGEQGKAGGEGGEGGFAICASSNEIYITQNSAYYVKGGNGGDGGDGGKGGAGGNGASDTSANIFNGVGDPGDGGNGGKGGSNGKAGQGSYGTNCETLKTDSGEKGIDGDVGEGGDAGFGGKNGVVGKGGGDGNRGAKGGDGDKLVIVVSKALAAGQQQQYKTVVDLPYAFSATFFNLYM